MPEVEVPDPPTEVIEQAPPPVPKVPEPLKVKAGDKFRAEFDKLTKAQAEAPVAEPPKEEPKVVEPSKEEPKTEVKPAEEKPPQKPTSPLDLITSDKKPDVKTEEPDELKEFEDVKAPVSEHWSKLKQIAKKQSEEKKALEATIAELKKTPKTDPEEIARLAKERDELKQSLAEREELIQSIDVRLSSDYQATLKSRDSKIAKVASKAKAYGADEDALVGALSLPDGSFKNQQIKAAMAQVDPEDKTEIRLLVGEVDTLNEKLLEFEKDAPKKYEEIQSRREAQLREQQEASIKAIQTEFVKVAEKLPQDIVTLREVPEDVPGGTEWNQAIRKAKEDGLRILTPGGSDYDESAAIAVKGAHYDSLVKMFLKDHQELVDARKRLAEYDAGGPDFKGASKPAAEPKLTPAQKYHKAMADQQAGAQ